MQSRISALLPIAVCSVFIGSAWGADERGSFTKSLQSTATAASRTAGPELPGLECWQPAIRHVAPSVFRIGGRSAQAEGPHADLFGTAFLVSRKHRLLATAAHLADAAIMCDWLLAVPNGTATVYRIDRIWYHPGLLRRFDLGLYAQSEDPRDGEVSLPTMDVAILRIAEGGPALPGESVLARDDELAELNSNQIGHIGFPGAGRAGWPSASQEETVAVATGRITGLVAYTRNRGEDDAIPPGRRRWVRSNARLGEGASGGPLFLENGHVIALYSGSSSTPEGVPFEEFVRVDAVREVLAYHGLGDAAPGHAAEGSGRPVRQNDLRRDRIHGAIRLVRQAEELCPRGRYRAAVERCNEAIKLVPDYAWAYLRRGEAYVHYCAAAWPKLSAEERQRFAGFASDDIRRCIELLFEWNPYPGLLLAYANLYLFLARSDQPHILRNVEYVNGLIEQCNRNSDATVNVGLITCRAHCRVALGDYDGARRDFDEAVRLAPDEPRGYQNRAKFWARRNRPDLAASDEAAAQRLLRAKTTPPNSAVRGPRRSEKRDGGN